MGHKQKRFCRPFENPLAISIPEGPIFRIVKKPFMLDSKVRGVYGLFRSSKIGLLSVYCKSSNALADVKTCDRPTKAGSVLSLILIVKRE